MGIVERAIVIESCSIKEIVGNLLHVVLTVHLLSTTSTSIYLPPYLCIYHHFQQWKKRKKIGCKNDFCPLREANQLWSV